MKPAVLLVVMVMALFLGDDVLNAIGYPHNDFSSSFVFRLHPLTYLAGFLLLYYYQQKKYTLADLFKRMRAESYLVGACFILIGFLWVKGGLSAVSFLIDALCLPAMLSILFKITEQVELKKFRVVVFTFFFINAFIAIIEKLMQRSIFESTFHFRDYFRSTALHSHPLNNALIMAVLTVGLYLSSKKELKVLVLIVGMVSIFCFGGRGALLGVFIGIAVHLWLIHKEAKAKNVQNKEVKTGVKHLGALVVVSFLVIAFTGLGDRIVASFYFDSSAETRMTSLKVLEEADFTTLLLGADKGEISHFQHNAGVIDIENFWVDWTLNFGLLGCLLLAIFFFKFLYNVVKPLQPDTRFTLLAVFIFVASTNNSLSTNTLALSIFVVTCFTVFDRNEVVVKKPRFNRFAV